MKPYLKMTCDSWKLDENYIKINGTWHYLYRAIDKHDDTLDRMLSKHRNKKAAKRFFKKLLGNKHMKNDYKSTKSKSRYRQWYGSNAHA